MYNFDEEYLRRISASTIKNEEGNKYNGSHVRVRVGRFWLKILLWRDLVFAILNLQASMKYFIIFAVLTRHSSWFYCQNKNACECVINSLILFGIRKNYLICEKSILLYQMTRRPIKLNVLIIVRCHSYQFHTTFYPISVS
jgi:hypothetical protein